MRQRTFFFLRFGWRTYSVGQILMFKAQKHNGSAYECHLRPPEEFCGYKTSKHPWKTNHEAENFFPAKDWMENSFCGSNSHDQGTQQFS